MTKELSKASKKNMKQILKIKLPKTKENIRISKKYDYFLSLFQIKGFSIHYLEKVPEVKDTVHKQTLLFHICNMMMEKFPESTDLYSEFGAVCRASRVRISKYFLSLIHI